MITCVVEMFGLPREISGAQEVEIKLEDNASLGDVIAALRREIPALDGRVIYRGEDRLLDHCTFNINGQFYQHDNTLKIQDGARLRLLTLPTGG